MSKDLPKISASNTLIVEEMYQSYLADPSSVSAMWQDYFSDFNLRSAAGSARPAATTAPLSEVSEAPVLAQPTVSTAPIPAHEALIPRLAGAAMPEGAAKLKGVGKAIAGNMQESLTVPTATSFRDVPATLMEVNRRIINGHLSRQYRGKLSFTHIIGWALVKALMAHPDMTGSYGLDEQGAPWIRVPATFNLGLAVDVQRKGTRTLVVPNIKAVNTMTFSEYWHAYETMIRKVNRNELTPDMFADTTVTLTNPGGIGTVASVPRLMPGQSAIIGAGAIGYAGQFKGASQQTMAELGISKVITITSTYDHRVIQGAESGAFLKTVEEFLLGEHDFYKEIFAELRVPYAPFKWSVDNMSAVTNNKAIQAQKQAAVLKIIDLYRFRGHLNAAVNPLIMGAVERYKELDPLHHGLTLWDLDREFYVDGFAGQSTMLLHDALAKARDTYCRTLAVEYMHNDNAEKTAWWQHKLEIEDTSISQEDRHRILDMLNEAEVLETFLGKKYLGQKRFSLEGGDALIPMLDALVNRAADSGTISQAIIGMPHRGRLNVLANIMHKKVDKIFGEFEGNMTMDTIQGAGDVKYHLGQSSTHTSPKGNDIRIELAANPSHLEAVNPVVEGMARAIQDTIASPYPQDGVEFPSNAGPVLPILVHGDAAFIGQGVVAETIGMSRLEGYYTGGTIHIIVNNQIGFTTSPDRSRSSRYASDTGKIIGAPVLHVNGDDPEACVRAINLAYDYRATFGSDIIIDVICYRRHGHNEADEPAFTQPLMYKAISNRRTVRKEYIDQLLARGEISIEEAEAKFEAFQSSLDSILTSVRDAAPQVPQDVLPPAPTPLNTTATIETGVPKERLEAIVQLLTSYPDAFNPHPKLDRLLDQRKGMWNDSGIDWPFAELLAFGTLLQEGNSVRLAGQDSARGTFSQRHATFQDYEDGSRYIPLQHVPVAGQPDGPVKERIQGQFSVYESPLNEYAALGFEYGYSLMRSDALVMWEAQFGDFSNGAQIIIDQFITAAWAKWKELASLVLLLPHGYEGQGPEHSSARIERWLTLASANNMEICQPSTAASYFHLLRRHMMQDADKTVPMVVFTPKSMLRAEAAKSPVDAFINGRFNRIIVEQDNALPVPADQVQRVVLASGKVTHEFLAARTNEPVALIRVEELYPWPEDKIVEELQRFPNITEIMWLQDEPENMGPWPFVRPRIRQLIERLGKLDTITRVHSNRYRGSSPATGNHLVHELETKQILANALAGPWKA